METRKACHNCRRNRRRCDRSVPSCNKCHSLGQECLGYGQLFRWTDSIASRGHMKGKATFTKPKSGIELQRQDRRSQQPTWSQSKPFLNHSLIDPIFQDLDGPSKFYLHYYTSRLSTELVVHDHVGINPFKDLVPMSARHTFLRPIIIASSALHYSNLIRRAAPGDKPDSAASINALVHALHARHDAIKALQTVLERWQLEKLQGAPRVSQRTGPEIDAFLATVIFFINFALIDSDGGGWQAHLGAAGRLLIAQDAGPGFDASNHALKVQAPPVDEFEACLTALFPEMVSGKAPPLSTTTITSARQLTVRDYVASDAVAYYVWKNTLEALVASPSALATEGSSSGTTGGGSWELNPDDLLPILLRTEANCYHSCPAAILHLMLRTSRLVRHFKGRTSHIAQADRASPQWHDEEEEKLSMFMGLLHEGQNFDVEVWAANMSARNATDLGGHMPPELEMALRMHIANVYRATACLYILLATPGLYRFVERQRFQQPERQDLPTLPHTSELADLILSSLSLFEPTSPFFKYTTWPVFMAGVEAGRSGNRREWVLARLQSMYERCPWGMLKSAKDILVQIWAFRDQATASRVQKVEDTECEQDDNADTNASTAVVASSSPELLQADDDYDWLSKLRGIEIECLFV
ncbi:fungal-specific transcription factor domain-domain-containing protein [Microdochium bolleyi]|uniref:Fungal-specific transcription factor domain-domain-containing protein n=1 Tax=Microdochium bolleyi TaxID=196109 RepID=A0A136J244_9PEZI|nr:fungal-specific transcription factor domain-domain-containing protein [Microdochium bolleyi]